MAYPYIPSGGLIQTAFQQFRKSFPSKVDAETLKKLGIASSNEGALINILKFIGAVDKENQRTPEGMKLFTTHDDNKFQDQLAEAISAAYSELFDLHGAEAWKLDRNDLISFFRGSDQTSAVTGARQALTFQSLASLAGKRDEQIPSRAAPGPRSTEKKQKAKSDKPNGAKSQAAHSVHADSPVGLTVRIEINLPANGTQATYDNIFESIRKNLLNG